MDDKHILIVDDEESILTVLKNSLKKLGVDYQVTTATNGFAALDRLQEQAFDLVVTDYNMAEMDGLELLEAIRYLQPQARVIMITAYGYEALEREVRRLNGCRYLTKPLEINVFRQIVQEMLGMASRPGILVLSDEKYHQVNHVLEQLRADVGGRCVFLTDADGRIIVRTGDTDKLAMEEIASLLGGGIVTLQEAGRSMDGETDSMNLGYREGKQDELYAVNVGRRRLLIIVIKRGPYSSRLGSVWYQARQAATNLRQALAEAEYAHPRQIFSKSLDRAFELELDKLFNGL